MKYTTLLTLILFVNFGISQKGDEGNNYTGRVFELLNNDSLLPLPGVNVYYLGSNDGTVTNLDGIFHIPKTQE